MSLLRRFQELLAALATVLVLMLAAPSAPVRAATFTLPSLVSYTGGTLASDAYQPVIAGNGDYVVFYGIFGGVTGVWERDLQTGDVESVAGANSADPDINAPDAGSPSVSANGQYVAFTSTADLTQGESPDPDPDPASGCANVWVRDMDIPASDPGAYTLVSALSGVATGIAYGGAGTSGCPGGGSAAADRVAISADGNEVAFTVMGASDLTTGSPSELTTPVDQVAVRYIAQQQTVLVSQTLASEVAGAMPAPVPSGAAITSIGDATTVTTSVGGDEVAVPVDASTAAISADGSTVAWMGINIPSQAPASSADAGTGFDEPLWREIALGTGAPTRRVTGGDDPAAPGGQGPFDEQFNYESQSTDVPEGPEFGAYTAPNDGFGGLSFFGTDLVPLDAATPALSANGQEVAFVSNEPLNAQLPTALNGNTSQWGPNAYVVNMASGLDRDQALTPLTYGGGDVLDVAISPDGTKVALTSTATAFPLAWPTLVTPPLTVEAALESSQLYYVDLTAGTISLASYGYDGNPANGVISTPSFTDDGTTVAFASTATNLVYGARNDGTNVFMLTENTTPDVPGTVTISPAPSSLPAPAWVLSARAEADKTGKATVSLSVPGAGSVSAVATTLASAGAKASRVATAAKTVRGAGVVTLTLTPKQSLTAKLRRKSGLYTQVRVSFTAAGHKALTKTVQLTLRDKVKPKKIKKTKKKKRKQKRREGTLR